MKVLVLDIGGSNLKLRMSGQEQRTKVPTGPEYGPERLVADLAGATADWDYEVVTVGFPAPIIGGRIPFEPQNLGSGWVDFRFEEVLGKPVKLINDAAMQAVGCYEGGRMLFLSLGTGLGSALIVDFHVIPLELSDLRWSRSSSLEAQLGKAAMKQLGKAVWHASVLEAVAMLREALLPDSIVIGGGGAKHLGDLPADVRQGHNEMALIGGERIWTDPRFRL
jgi:predicted NBD/HSP70 family sugar kinase